MTYHQKEQEGLRRSVQPSKTKMGWGSDEEGVNEVAAIRVEARTETERLKLQLEPGKYQITYPATEPNRAPHDCVRTYGSAIIHNCERRPDVEQRVNIERVFLEDLHLVPNSQRDADAHNMFLSAKIEAYVQYQVTGAKDEAVFAWDF